MIKTDLPAGSSPQPKPLQPGQRIEVIDVLRGFAVLGILVANMLDYGGLSRELHVWPGVIDRIALILNRFLIEAKFYSLFSLLFGWGMAIQLARAEQRGTNFVAIYVRRMVILLAFGLMHGILVWTGDILTYYAILGLILLLFRKRSARFLLISVPVALAFSIVLTAPGAWLDAFRGWYERVTDFMRFQTLPATLYGSGSYWQITRLRWQEFARRESYFIYSFGNVFAMFLLGLYAGKRRLMDDPWARRNLFRWLLWGGLLVGGAFNGFFSWLSYHPDAVSPAYFRLLRVGARTIGAPALMLSYVAAIVLLFERPNWRQRLLPLAPVGRMALSNYLLQSLVCTFIFYKTGLGLFGQINPTFALILALLIYAGQVRLSAWWLDRFRFGPLEWLWRSLTYGRWQSMRPDGANWGWLRSIGGDRLLRLVRRQHPLLWLALAWCGLAVWVGLLWQQFGHLWAPPAVDVVQVTATPVDRELMAGDDRPAEQAMLYPAALAPLDYELGPLAAQGDMVALASSFDGSAALELVKTLSQPPMLGRLAGSPAGRAARQTIAGQFELAGLLPAGDEGGYFQTFPISYTVLAQAPRLLVSDGMHGDRQSYRAFQDFAPLIGQYGGSGSASGQVVWLGDCSRDAFAGVDVLGKIVLCAGGDALQAERRTLEYGAGGLLLVADPATEFADRGEIYAAPWVAQPLPVLRVQPSVVEDLLAGSGIAADELAYLAAPRELTSWAELAVETNDAPCAPASGCSAANVLGILPGRDAELAHEVVLVGAHYDHVGTAPAGVAWPGANGNASGVAVLLQLAQDWHAQGYVPRRTVLFAAWDAGEMEATGLRYFVAHPRVAPDSIVAQLELDQLGAGSETLYLAGAETMAGRATGTAEALDLPLQAVDTRPETIEALAELGPAALLLTRDDGTRTTSDRWRTSDTWQRIEVEMLVDSGRLAGLLLLDLVESEPAIQQMLAQRATAVATHDLTAFLGTSTPDQLAIDRVWFDDLQTLTPREVSMAVSDLEIVGRQGVGQVEISLVYAGSNGIERSRDETLAVQFERSGAGWRWAGPDLARMVAPDEAPADGGPSETDFSVYYPAGWPAGPAGLAERAGTGYSAIVAQLDLPSAVTADIQLLAGEDALRANTAWTLPADSHSWVGEGLIRLARTDLITSSSMLTDTLVQLALATAGVERSEARWLWDGLPLVYQELDDPAGVQGRYLPALQEGLLGQKTVSTATANWAATRFLLDTLGWQGSGRFIARLGADCAAGQCGDGTALARALDDVLHLEGDDFEGAWQHYWRERLATLQRQLDQVLASRAEAIGRRDLDGLLATVDASVPGLRGEQANWLQSLPAAELAVFDLNGRPMAIMPDGSLLARVEMVYQPAGAETGWLSLDIRFVRDNDRLLWAGAPLNILPGELVDVLYVAGERDVALQVRDEATLFYRQLADYLDEPDPERLTLKLFTDPLAFAASIGPAYEPVNWSPFWVGAGGAIKLLLPAGQVPAGLYGTISEHFLAQNGAGPAWLLKGMGVYLPAMLGWGEQAQLMAAQLPQLWQAVQGDEQSRLDELWVDRYTSYEEWSLAIVQAWDVSAYLVEMLGWEALKGALMQGEALDVTLERVAGRTVADLEAEWATSMARAHVRPEWLATSAAFDAGRAMAHVAFLAADPLAGRASGSTGEQLAADYVAELFQQYGLEPAGEPTGSGFLQAFPITTTEWLTAPHLILASDQGQVLTTLQHREDYVVRVANGGGTVVQGELVWLASDDDPTADLAGKIVLRPRAGTLGDAIAVAQARNAAALVLVGDEWREETLLAKRPLGASAGVSRTLPVVELTRQGVGRLLAAANLAGDGLLDLPSGQALGVTARLALVQTVRAGQSSNVLAVLPGSDPLLQDEIVIVGAHLDHVGDDPAYWHCPTGVALANYPQGCNWTPGRRYDGANDDASGVALMLELARLWQANDYRPARTVVFAGWGAQELGQVGANYFVGHPTIALDRVVAVVQLDGVAGGDGVDLGAKGRWVHDGALLFQLQAAAFSHNERLVITEDGGTSDQLAFAESGVPSVLVSWRLASEENWQGILADQVSERRMAVSGRLVSLAMMLLAR